MKWKQKYVAFKLGSIEFHGSSKTSAEYSIMTACLLNFFPRIERLDRNKNSII